MEKSESSPSKKDPEQKDNKASDSNEGSDISISSDEGGSDSSHVFPSLANLNFKPSFFESTNDRPDMKMSNVDNLMSDSLVYQYLVEEGHDKTAKLLLNISTSRQNFVVLPKFHNSSSSEKSWGGPE